MESRRAFITGLASFAAGLVSLPMGKAWAKKLAISLDKVKKLQKVDGWTILKIKERQILFVRDGQDSIKAMDPVCTHQKCLVGYDPKGKRIACGCHKSHYDLTGKVLDGPAPAPLKTYPAKLSKGRIILTLD
jgi:Rieske Fe-S protein